MDDKKEIFDHIKKLMKKYKPPFIAPNDFALRYELWSKKEIVIEGRKWKEIYFAGIVIQSNYVGFYFMPIYADTTLK